jgi:hypothetical protein
VVFVAPPLAGFFRSSSAHETWALQTADTHF